MFFLPNMVPVGIHTFIGDSRLTRNTTYYELISLEHIGCKSVDGKVYSTIMNTLTNCRN